MNKHRGIGYEGERKEFTNKMLWKAIANIQAEPDLYQWRPLNSLCVES